MRYGTAYFGLDTDSSIFGTAFRALAEGNSIRGTARIVEIDPQSCREWLHRYAQHCRLVMLYLWRKLHLEEYVWTTSELLSYRVPVAFLNNLDQIETLFPPFDDFAPGEPAITVD